MKRILYILTAIALAASCGGNRSTPKESADELKMQFRDDASLVDVLELRREPFKVQILSNGKVSALRKADLVFKSSGTVSYLCGGNGKRVSKGSVIAALDRPDLDMALETAQIALDQAKLDLLDRLAGLGYSPSDSASVPSDIMHMARLRSGYSAALNALKKARYDKQCASLTAPFSGVLANLSLKLYDQAGSSAVCTLIDDRSMEVKFTVMEAEIGGITPSMDVFVEPFVGGGGPYRAKLSSVNPIVEKNGLVELSCTLQDRTPLVDGMHVHVVMEKALSPSLIVPKSAVVVRDNMNVLFTYGDDGLAHWIYINIIASNSDSYAVEANRDRGASLSEGERVIVSGNLNLADGSKVSLRQ